jgi:hypothetical protein
MNKTKKNVFLDLDNTLLSAEALEDFPFEQDGIKDKAIQFAIHDMDGYYIIFERPLVQEFLDWLFENYNVSVWTAASKDYALFIVEHILLKKPGRKLDWILSSYHCDISKKKYSKSKQLKLVFDQFKFKGFNCYNTIIIDDLDEVHTCQPDISIHIKAFEILDDGSEYDIELEHTKNQVKAIFKKLEFMKLESS